MHDGVSYEQFGKPALVLCTEPFRRTAQSIAAVLKVPDYRFVTVEHPLGSRTLDEVKVQRKGETLQVDGSADLGLFGKYSFEGKCVGDDYKSTYISEYDRGIFDLKRTAAK
mgnify:CR=1 FL=1